MSKELEDLDCGEEVKTKYGVCYAYSPDVVEEFRQALQRLEAIDNANPSEALVDLEKMANQVYQADDEFGFYYDKVKQALLKAQEMEKTFDEMLVYNAIMMGFDYKEKQLVAMPLEEYDKLMKQEKVLSIIKEKRIDIESFYITFIEEEFDYNHYEKYYGTYGLECLTQEEFDLLMRWLG